MLWLCWSPRGVKMLQPLEILPWVVKSRPKWEWKTSRRLQAHPEHPQMFSGVDCKIIFTFKCLSGMRIIHFHLSPFTSSWEHLPQFGSRTQNFLNVHQTLNKNNSQDIPLPLQPLWQHLEKLLRTTTSYKERPGKNTATNPFSF